MKRLTLVCLCLLLFPLMGCNKVPAGYVGVKVFLLGGSKGVDMETLGPGRYWIGWNEELHLFPTYTVTYPWTKTAQEGKPVDESISFQTKEGLSVNSDIGISYHIEKEKVAAVFQKYRKGIEEITDTFLRNMVRDAFVSVSSSKQVESVYGEGKATLISEVEKLVRDQAGPIGIVVEKIYYIGDLRLPPQVVEAVNAKISATQKAQQRENELRQAEAEAKKVVAAADGDAKSTLVRAEAEAKAIKLKSEAITPQLIQYEATQKWNGTLPQFMGGGSPIPFLNIESLKAAPQK
jgi:regulator of protease activity HflC (stomatin/prohibitin superfamily)